MGQPPRGRENCRSGKPCQKKRAIIKEMAMKKRKPVPKVKINSNVGEIRLKRANLALNNIKQGQDLNITEINNLLYATAWAITDMVD